MSAFAVVYERNNTLADPGVLFRVLARLNPAGVDGQDVLVDGHVALGHQHFWTTPEEVGEKQPLCLDGLPFKLVFDGRLDNRDELFDALQITPRPGKSISDAVLTLRAYAQWGEGCFEHFVGEYALVIIDDRRGVLVCARDALGDRTLFYTFQGTRLVIASEPWAVAAMDEKTAEIDENSVVDYLAMRAPHNGATFFKNIHELQPAHAMTVSSSTERSWRHWRPDPARQLRGRSDQEYAEQFRALLDESVRCRLRASTPAGILMSGGLDSTSLACLAARALAPGQLTTLSMVFDELPECDERQYIEAVRKAWDIRSIQIPCDDTWPYKDWQHWPLNPNRPEGTIYRLSKERVYARAQSEGMRVVLTGGAGDYLYIAGGDWLADFVLEGKFAQAGRELLLQIRAQGWRETQANQHLRRLVRRWLEINLPGARRLPRKQTSPDWLNRESAGLLAPEEQPFPPEFDRYSTLLGMTGAWGTSSEIYNARRHDLELRHPYRDRRLVEFILSVPAYQLFYRGFYKHILRQAMDGILPEEIRIRRQPTSLLALLFRGFEREKDCLRETFAHSDGVWRQFISAEWLASHKIGSSEYNQESLELLIFWHCISYQSWHSLLSSPH